MWEFLTLLVQCTGLFLPPVLVRIQKPSAHQVYLFFGTTTSIGAVVEAVPALVTDQSESCRGDDLVRFVADSPLFSLQGPSHHLPLAQDFDCFASFGS